MTLPFAEIGLPEFALRVESRSGRGDWLVLEVPDGTCQRVGNGLIDELSALGSTPAVHLVQPRVALDLAHAIHSAPRESRVVVSAADSLNEAEWRHLDLLRSLLSRRHAVILLLTTPSIERLVRDAPNISSWIGSSVWALAQPHRDEVAASREKRLRDLRSWSSMSDGDVIRLAQEKSLPAEPEYVEWLILMGRGDLLE